MKNTAKTLELKFERVIPAPPGEVFDGWLDPKTPGTPWNENDKLILNPKVDGFFYWLIHGTSHYGRFTKIERPGRIEHTWMSRYTEGKESTVTVTFKKKGAGTQMTLVHSGRRMPPGTSCKINFLPLMMTVCPALCPPA